MSSNIYINLLLFLAGSFLGSYCLFPKIIGMAHYMGFTAGANSRSSHYQHTPNIGGFVFFIAIAMGVYCSQQFDVYQIGLPLLVGTIVLFLTGLKDDLMVVSNATKTGGQLLAIALVLVNPALHITTLHGFFGIGEVSILFTLPFSAFVMYAIINAFNLIDGIDGLAAMVAILILGFLGYLFLTMNLYFFVGLSVLMIGSLLAFLFFNLSANKKIFMGDSGSLIIGFVIATAVIRIFAVPTSKIEVLPFMNENLHIVVLSVLILPFLDTVRVFTIRLLNKKSPFKADRNHIHHVLIDDVGLSHKATSFLLVSLNLTVSLLFYFLAASVNSGSLLVLFFFYIMYFSIVIYRIKNSRKVVSVADELN